MKNKDGTPPRFQSAKNFCKAFFLGVWVIALACMMSSALAPIKDGYSFIDDNNFGEIASRSKYAICGSVFIACILAESRSLSGSVQHGGASQPSLGYAENGFEDPKKSVAFKGGQFTLPRVLMRIGWALSFLFFATFFWFWGIVFISFKKFIQKFLKPKRFSGDFIGASIAVPVSLNLLGFLILW